MRWREMGWIQSVERKAEMKAVKEGQEIRKNDKPENKRFSVGRQVG
jgi:hypothetical protein